MLIEETLVGRGNEPLDVDRSPIGVRGDVERSYTLLVKPFAPECATVVGAGCSLQLGIETLEGPLAPLQCQRDLGGSRLWELLEVAAKAELHCLRGKACLQLLTDHLRTQSANMCHCLKLGDHGFRLPFGVAERSGLPLTHCRPRRLTLKRVPVQERSRRALPPPPSRPGTSAARVLGWRASRRRESRPAHSRGDASQAEGEQAWGSE